MTLFISDRSVTLRQCLDRLICTSVHVTVNSYPLRYCHIQALRLVVVFGSEGVLEPVIDMNTPGGIGFAQLIELAQVLIGYTDAIRLAVFEGLHLPVVLTRVNTGFT